MCCRRSWLKPPSSFRVSRSESPESIRRQSQWMNGFRVRDFVAPRNDGGQNGEGSDALTSNPSLRYQPACKPGSVGHRPLPRTMRDGHSSGTMFAHGLEQPTRTAGLTSPRGVIACANSPLKPSLFGFAPGGVYHAGSVAGAAVRSYRTFSPLLPPRRERFVLCGTFPKVTLAGRYPAPHVKGARTFLPGGLSALAGAAVRPTDGLRMEHL